MGQAAATTLPAPRKNKILTDTYATLLSQVKKTLVEGQRRLEEERVKIYLTTGQLIRAHILQNSDRAQYGGEVLKRLAKDLKMDLSVLQRCIKFAKIYSNLPIEGGHPQFKWSHYLKLITITDDKKRLAFEKAVVQNEWSAEELAARMKKELKPVVSVEKKVAPALLSPLRGIPYTYQVVERPNVKPGQSALRIDLGFGVFHKVEPRLINSFNKGDIVESRSQDDAYKFVKTDRSAKDLFTYWADVEKIIDGDTLKVRFDLGFNVEARDTLRLRGIDCPEMDTKEGQAAKAFVQSYIKEAQSLIVRSSRSEKYGRYLADVFIPQGGEPDPSTTLRVNPATDIYLNNLLLEKGHAKRWGSS